jgi:hypothetical protein
MGEILLYFSGFAFIAIDGILKTIRDVEDFDLQGPWIQRLILNKTTMIISLIMPLICWFQIYNTSIINIVLIITINTFLTIFLGKIIAIPFLLRITGRGNDYYISRTSNLFNTFLIAVLSLIIGSIIN